MTNHAPNKDIREAFERHYAKDADDPASATELTLFTQGWRACIMSQLHAPVADERTLWLVCLSREYYEGGDFPLLAVPTEAMAEQIAADLRQYCRDLREQLDAYNWQQEADPEESNRLYEESAAIFTAAQFPHGVTLDRCHLDNDFTVAALSLRGATASLANASSTDRTTTGLYLAPAKCPITGRPFFMMLEHPELGWVPTYGGPYDSYTIPHPDGNADQPWHERELLVHRYDHDLGGWRMDAVEVIPLRIIHEDVLAKMSEAHDTSSEAK